jgi:glutathione synthase/RimK-type ligase-like ATP-grasp enzyme
MTAYRRPLILSALAHDIHASSVRWALRASGIDAVWAGSLAQSELGPMSLHCDADTGLRMSGALDGDSIGAVWYRRARNPESFPRAHDGDQAFLRGEWGRFLKNVYALTDHGADRLWVNRPNAAAMAENKLVQLRAAHRCGLRFPPTLVSHDPQEIRRFVQRHGRVVYKPFMTHTWKDAETGRMFSTYARIVELEMLEDDASLLHCPGIYQVYVDKRCDLRVTAIGDRYFAARLHTQHDDGFVDWRVRQSVQGLRAEPGELSASDQAKLAALMRELGLVFGCIDLAIDANGEAHFLEVNQAGQFLFVEDLLPSLPLLRAMSAMLAEGRPDYSLATIAQVSYADYCASEEHREWWAQASGTLRDRSPAASGITLE